MSVNGCRTIGVSEINLQSGKHMVAPSASPLKQSPQTPTFGRRRFHRGTNLSILQKTKKLGSLKPIASTTSSSKAKAPRNFRRSCYHEGRRNKIYRKNTRGSRLQK